MPKRMAAMPRSTSAHQLLVNTSNILFPSFLTYLVGAALRGRPGCVGLPWSSGTLWAPPGFDGGRPRRDAPTKWFSDRTRPLALLPAVVRLPGYLEFAIDDHPFRFVPSAS